MNEKYQHSDGTDKEQTLCNCGFSPEQIEKLKQLLESDRVTMPVINISIAPEADPEAIGLAVRKKMMTIFRSVAP